MDVAEVENFSLADGSDCKPSKASQTMASSAGLVGLPEEILEAIFRMATAGPGFASYRDPDIEFGWPHTMRIVREFRESLIIKRSVVLVCRAFWRIGIPLLFDTILLEEAGRSKALADALSVRSSRNDHHTNLSPEPVTIATKLPDHRVSYHVKTIVVLPYSLPDIADVYSFSRAYESILGLCPSLQRIVVRIPKTNSTSVQLGWALRGPSFIQATPLTVAHLDIQPATDLSCEPVYLKETLAAPHLRSLRIAGTARDNFDRTSYDFPSLSHLCIDTRSISLARLLPLWKMDSLTHLYLANVVADSEEATEFWKLEKPSITLLHFGDASSITHALACAILNGVPNLRALEYFHNRNVSPIWKRSLLPQSFERAIIAVGDTFLLGRMDYLRLAEQLHEFQYPPLSMSTGPPIVLLGTILTADNREFKLKRTLETFRNKPRVEVKHSKFSIK